MRTRMRLVSACAIAIMLMLMASSSLATAWFCPECGKGNEGNFCYNCGEKRPEEKSTGTGISDLHFTLMENGDIRVSWNDSNSSPPYTVSYEGKYDSGEMEPVRGREYALQFLIPGESYNIVVSNEKGSDSAKYTVPVKVYTEFGSAAR